MLFNSLHFLIFLPVVAIAYFTLGLRARRVMLLAASFYFYCVFSVKLSVLLIWSAGLDFAMGRVIEANRHRPRVMKAALLASLVGNLGTLAVFKYGDFLNLSLASVLGFQPWPLLDLVLPMGISFYTFQTISYIVDVYRGKLQAQKSITDYALFVTFFPHLVAGPILRATDVLPQFREHHFANSERILSGVLLLTWGLTKKVFIADPIGHIADTVYGTQASPYVPGAFGGLALLLGTYAFAVQIYCDFSAYSDIAIGSGRLLGYRIKPNFDKPYLATTIREFWRCWHMSLSGWLRDYLYIPLGGSRGSAIRTYVNLGLTMFLGGLWHGANWTFVIWGLLHGLYLAGERMLGIDQLDRSKMSVTEQWLRGFVTFHLVCLAWVFFRAATANQAFEMLGGIATWRGGDGIAPIPLLALGLLLAVQIIKQRVDFGGLMLQRPAAARWLVYGVMAVIAAALAGGRSPEFIYFQF